MSEEKTTDQLRLLRHKNLLERWTAGGKFTFSRVIYFIMHRFLLSASYERLCGSVECSAEHGSNSDAEWLNQKI
jgi:hypothetical protein